ncbi:AT-rich interactive domain-containing protein 5B isoform X1, partial [Tachysurus ichikawai]
WVGSPCGLHGPYIFYKAFRFNLQATARILSLGDFFFVRCKPQDPVCVAELQLLWEERTSKQLLSSSKLYFLPEDCPQGRTVSHGEVITHVHSRCGTNALVNAQVTQTTRCGDLECSAVYAT